MIREQVHTTRIVEGGCSVECYRERLGHMRLRLSVPGGELLLRERDVSDVRALLEAVEAILVVEA